MLRRRWPEVLDTLSRLRKATWALVSQNAQVADLTDSTLRLTFASAGLATAFRSGPGAELVQRAVRETLGFDVRVEGGIEEPGRAPARSVDTVTAPTSRTPSAGSVAGIDPVAAAASWDVPAPVGAPAAPQSAPASSQGGGDAPSDAATTTAPTPAHQEAPSVTSAASPAPPGEPAEYGEEPPGDFDHEPAPEFGQARSRGGSGAQAESPRQAAERRAAAQRAQDEARAKVVDDPQPDDEDLASSGQVGAPLVAQILGGVVIEEILDSEV